MGHVDYVAGGVGWWPPKTQGLGFSFCLWQGEPSGVSELRGG